jgi:type I restriction enzyme M protein
MGLKHGYEIDNVQELLDRLDRNGHLIVDHDLHNHNGEMPDGIAEAFIQWAKKEKLSFWKGK